MLYAIYTYEFGKHTAAKNLRIINIGQSIRASIAFVTEKLTENRVNVGPVSTES